MKPLSQRITQANALLEPYAVPHEGRLGRVYDEPEDETRFPFQRDRDRIIHTQAFRRLQGKTQVFVAGESDHYRTRLTHTLEVAQIARDLARAMGLNEDLAECIALAHDLGHPPFGHAGEEALDAWMQGQGGRFEHNLQSHRIVTVLERHSSLHPGLNVQREIVDGLLKHSDDAPKSLEAELTNLADEVAYTGHDCDDGLLGGIFERKDLLDIPLVRRAHERTRERKTSLRGSLIHLLATDVIETSLPRLGSSTLPHITFSLEMRAEVQKLRAFLHSRMYLHPSIVTRTERGQTILSLLCRHLLRHPSEKILLLQERTDGTLAEAVKDYVAGMTDQYAEAQAEALGISAGMRA